jgi:hypothetical protein
MKDSSDKNSGGARHMLDPLAQAYRDAASAHAASLKRGLPVEVLTTYRAVLVAEAAMLRDCGGRLDEAAADAVAWEIERVDRDLADLAAGRLRSTWGWE